MAGSLFENHVIADIYKKELHKKSRAELYYYRTTKGLEVDLIIDRKIRREFIEIKLNATFNHKWLKPIELLKSKEDMGYLLYPGKPQNYLEGILVMNYVDYAKI